MSSPLDSPNWCAMIWANRPLRPRGHHHVALLGGQLGGWSPSECMRRILDPSQSRTEETVCFLQELTSSDEPGGVELRWVLWVTVVSEQAAKWWGSVEWGSLSMFIGREGETASADPSSREQQQQYAFNKNKYSSRWLEYTIWLCIYRGIKPATLIIIIIVRIIIFQTKSWHQVLKVFLQAAKNAIQKLEKVIDSPHPHHHQPTVRWGMTRTSSA